MMEKLKLKLLFVCALVFLMGAGQVLGDWDPGDGHKMHWPQTPKPGGFDVDFYYTQALGDDWRCTETGPVTDIHFWASWKWNDVGTIDGFTVTIYDDDPCGTGGYSQPNTPQWTRNFIAGDFTVRDMQPDLQGWFEPDISSYDPCNHSEWCQVNITDIDDPFIQKAGEIYWLVISDVDTPFGTQLGWKETYRNFNDDGVWRLSAADGWEPLENPDSTTMDLAFVITGEKDVKNKNLKWSQPPIEWDPTWDIPVYCGWDELSLRDWIEPFWFDCWNCRTQCYGDADCDGYVDDDDLLILQASFMRSWPDPLYNPCADFDRDLDVDNDDLFILVSNWQMYPPADCSLRPQSWQMAADDFRCLGTMPITSIHWWGSHLGWEEPNIMPPDPDLPIAWRIGFWSNISATQRCDFLYGAATGVGYGNAPSSLYKIDPFTAVATLIGPIGFNGVTGLSFAPDGTLYGTCRDPVMGDAFLITIDTMTGAGTAVGRVNTTGTGQSSVPDISFRSNGVLYGYGDGPDQLITINTATGQGTAVGATGYNGGGNGLDFAPNGTLYATPYDNQSLVIINPATGAGSDVAGTVGNVPYRVNALEFCDSTGVLYGSWNDKSGLGNWYLVTLDLTTGLPTVIGQTVQGLDAITFNTFSHPGELLWQIEVPEDRVDVNEVGSDEYPMMPYYDICYQYYLDLEQDEWFWQNKYETQDHIYWLSIAAVHDPCVEGRQFPWGWKTRPWSWMDDAVRFWMDENPEPGMVLDPGRNMIEPIEDPIFYESFDLAFELDTDPNYIKWEQPFTGIRDWPHYEDEKSMAIEITTAETVTKYIQHPDLSPNGVDVDATTQDDGVWSAQSLADDFNCTTTGLITDIHIWGSWYHDYPFPEDVDFYLNIYSDNPVGPNGWSEPNEWLWGGDFPGGDYDVSIEASNLNEGYYVPCAVPPFYEPNADTICYKYDFYIDPPYAFLQRGSPDNPVVYWLVVSAYTLQPTGPMAEQEGPIRFGWKTSTDHWNDDAVWTDDFGDSWNELRYPAGHPFAGQSIDLAFKITTEEEETELIIDRLAADDWPCDGNEPVSAAVWWGSYIGYEYAACDIQGPWMPLPVPPKYFLLNIWTDVPADSTDPMSYSHPNDILWKYKAYDYDEVLVGYDKHPEEPDPNGGGHEPVFRYSVRIPKKDWFYQKEPNNVYWFSVVAVYDANVPAVSVVVDDMESYDTVINPIRDTWLDGFWNWTGSNVSLGIAPNDPVHGGTQSMEYYYLNIFDLGVGYYSETEATTAALGVSSDWVSLGVNKLALWFYGDPNNYDGDTEQMYVGLEDSMAMYGQVNYANMSDIKEQEWHLWCIDLQDFANAGVDLTDVQKIYIGFGIRGWPFPGGYGVVYFDDIALYDECPDEPSNYPWGWTNHEHVYNDDAVEGYLDPCGPEPWSWYELYDQTGMSEDMSFILFNGCPCKADVSDTTGFGPPDGKVDIGDLNYTLMAMFSVYPMGDPSGLYVLSPIPPGLECMDVSDTTGFGPPDGQVDIGDLNYVLMAMFTAYPMGDPTGIYQIPCLP